MGVDGDIANTECERPRGRVPIGDHDCDADSASDGVDVDVNPPTADAVGVGVMLPLAYPALGDEMKLSSPLENDVDLLCSPAALRARGVCSDEVMSMLPPPTTARLSSLARSALSVRACSDLSADGGRGEMTDSVPVSWA